ncbi:lanthionine synthetase LanC family protein [Catellatospora sp. KI3]|uniref:lanthionine synthetase LanC family protein n=1 Tax=Catellatospora sp. KI3 TaxID=3041620 RepID=UPI002482A45E|nr:lanthionine synthetase LanC family protein [Catellatospora sp. KI3]MDI1461268.1 lanthionine synthetase LanC family protein [Catellatospora sp. KI3]
MIEGRFTLPDDVRLEAVESMPAQVLAGFAYATGDFVLTRPRSRMPTHVVNEPTMRLLRLFREPMTITDAVIAFCDTARADPATVLDRAFPVLRTLIGAKLLLPAESQLASPIEFLLAPGERAGDLVIEEPVAIVADTEVYRARTADRAWAAIKMARPGAEEFLRPALDHEASVLALLGGGHSPRMLARGDHGGRPFLAMEWCQGVDALAAAELIRGRSPVDWQEMTRLVIAVADAYTALHGQGVLHGDVHPRNLLIGRSGQATLIDFGQARCLRAGPVRQRPGRGVVDLYMEPELARTRLAGDGAPPPTEAGEQYSVAALVYFLISGSHTHDFVLEERQMLRQVADDAPRPLAERGLRGFDRTDRVLRRALAKEPEARYPDVAQFRTALRQALRRDRRPRTSPVRPQPGAPLLEAFLERSAVGGSLMSEGLEAPLASLNLGSAGLAFALLRIAQRRDAASLLAAADVWSQRALRAFESAGPAAFTAPDLEMTPELVGEVSLFHFRPGALCVAALVADAQSDEVRCTQAVESFIASAAARDPRAEVVFGQAGLLLGCGLLLDAIGARPGLAALGGDLHSGLLDQVGDIGESTSLGVAHGYAGVLYALLQWTKTAGAEVPGALRRRLGQLADLARPTGRGLGWPVSARAGRALDGLRGTWCNGAAGQLHLWLLAHELLEDSRYLDLATQAAWTCHEAQSTGGDLCCGSAGRAYALLRLFRHTGSQVWLTRARQSADHAATAIRRRRLRSSSLYRGEAGVCLLTAELDDPHQARMPMFELT